MADWAGSGFDWGSPPWGGDGTPPPPEAAGTAVAILKGVDLRGPGELVHEILGPDGADFPQIVGGFECNEVAPGGYDTASGTVESARVLDQPGIYTDGARWIVTDRASGREVWAGFLQDPAISGGQAVIKADGTGRDPDRTFGRLPMQIRNYSLWSDAAGDPFNMIRPDGSDLNDDKIQIDTSGGRMLFTVPIGTSGLNGDRNRTVLWTPGTLGNHPTRIAFHCKNRFDNGVWDLHIHTGKGPTGPITQRSTLLLDFFSADEDITFDSPANDDLIAITLQANQDFNSDGFTCELTALKVNYGGLVGDVRTSSEIARDLISRMGFGVSLVQESGFNAFPFDTGSESRAESLDRLAMLTDWRWLAYSDSIEFGPWDTRVWTVIDPELPVDLISLPRFDSVVVPFRYPNSTAVGEEFVVSAKPLPHPRGFGSIALPEPAPDRESANQMGQRVLDFLGTSRKTGSGSLAEVLDSNGLRQSANLVHAGDTLFFPLLGAQARIKSLRRTTAGPVQYQLDDRLATLDKLLARRSHRLQLQGLA